MTQPLLLGDLEHHRKEAILAARKKQKSSTPVSVFAKPCDTQQVKGESVVDKGSGSRSQEEAPPAFPMGRPSDEDQHMYPEGTKSLSPTKHLHESRVEKPKERGHRKHWSVADSFPSKLFDMLEEAEKAGHEHIISFLPHGKTFMVHAPDLFQQEVLPKYFKTNRLASFQKQLSVYGFKKIRSGADKGSIQREFFHRDNRELLAKIRRKKQRVPPGESVDQEEERAIMW